MLTPRASSTRIAARLTAISAGWAFSVSVRVSIGPSQMMSESFSPSASSTAVEDGARLGFGIGERLAHADHLAALPWKRECDRHLAPRRLSPPASLRRWPRV